MAVKIPPLPSVGEALTPDEEKMMENILVDVNGCICPDKEPYRSIPGIKKATRKGPGHPAIMPRKKRKEVPVETVEVKVKTKPKATAKKAEPKAKKNAKVSK